MTPIEVVKQRLQVHNSPYKGAVDCIRQTMAKEGVGAFYRSFTTQILMSIPFQITHLITYEVLKDSLNPDSGYNPSSHMIAGAGAGALAAAITNPFDVSKTLLNTQEQSGIRGVVPAFKAGTSEPEFAPVHPPILPLNCQQLFRGCCSCSTGSISPAYGRDSSGAKRQYHQAISLKGVLPRSIFC